MATVPGAVVVAIAIVVGCRDQPSKHVQSQSSTQEFVSGWEVHDAVGLRHAVAKQFIDDMQSQGMKFWHRVISYRVCDAGSRVGKLACSDIPDGLAINASGVNDGPESGHGSLRAVTIGPFWRCSHDKALRVSVTGAMFESRYEAEYLGVLTRDGWRAQFESGTHVDPLDPSSRGTRGCRTRS
jgi:hypothetical protein